VSRATLYGNSWLVFVLFLMIVDIMGYSF